MINLYRKSDTPLRRPLFDAFNSRKTPATNGGTNNNNNNNEAIGNDSGSRTDEESLLTSDDDDEEEDDEDRREERTTDDDLLRTTDDDDGIAQAFKSFSLSPTKRKVGNVEVDDERLTDVSPRHLSQLSNNSDILEQISVVFSYLCTFHFVN